MLLVTVRSKRFLFFHGLTERELTEYLITFHKAAAAPAQFHQCVHTRAAGSDTSARPRRRRSRLIVPQTDIKTSWVARCDWPYSALSIIRPGLINEPTVLGHFFTGYLPALIQEWTHNLLCLNTRPLVGFMLGKCSCCLVYSSYLMESWCKNRCLELYWHELELQLWPQVRLKMTDAEKH